MSLFDFAAAIRNRPSGDMTAQLRAAYGNPDGPGARQIGGGEFYADPTWYRQNIVQVPVSSLPGFPTTRLQHVEVHRLAAPALIATFEELAQRGLQGRLKTFNGSLVCRHMGHDVRRPLSVHSFGAALDFDAAWNGYGIPKAQMGIDRDVVRCFQECGWEWGGEWSHPYEDGMHFQWTDGLRGVQQPVWRDAMARQGAPMVVPVQPASPMTETPVLATAPQRQLYTYLRNPDGSPRADAISITVDNQGRVMIGPDHKPRAYYMNAALAAAKGVN